MKLTVRTPCNSMLGYGHVGLNILNSMENVDISLFPIGNTFYPTFEVDSQKLEDWTEIQNFDKTSPCLTIWHEFLLITEHIGTGPMIGLPFWEIDWLNNHRVVNMNYCDHLIVASKWAKTVAEESGVTAPITVIPMGVNRYIFNEHIVYIDRNPEKYKFFNIGKIEKRKGHDILHKAFAKAFEDVDDVELHMFCHNGFLSKEELDNFHKEYAEVLGDKYVYHQQTMKDTAFATEIVKLDCGVFPTRAEGFGLPILQSMSCGKPVIVMDYSAPTEFCNKDNAILLPFTGKERARDNKWFRGEAHWAKLDEDDLIEAMRYQYNNRDNNARNDAGIETAKSLPWEKTAHECLACINEV